MNQRKGLCNSSWRWAPSYRAMENSCLAIRQASCGAGCKHKKARSVAGLSVSDLRLLPFDGAWGF